MHLTAKSFILGTPIWLYAGIVLAQSQPPLPVDPQLPRTGISEPVCVGEEWLLLSGTQTLNGWRPSEFGADGSVEMVDGVIRLGVGDPLTGITYAGAVELPRIDYELRLQARRVDGSDFFCGLTFPYIESHCSLILGGWGGGLVGLSSLDGQDASENETTRYEPFQRGEWYDVRLRVEPGAITAWINDKQRVVCNVGNRAVSTRPEVLRSRPLGIASYRTQSEIKDISIRCLAPKIVSQTDSSSENQAAEPQ